MIKTFLFFCYSWFSTFLIFAFIILSAFITNLALDKSTTGEIVKMLYKILLYITFFVFLYKSILLSFKSKVTRLSFWRSKKEKFEDTEFINIIESLILIISLLFCIITSFIEEIIQIYIDGRLFEMEDILTSISASLLIAIIMYTYPILSEVDLLLKNRIKKMFRF